jgi:hypothetical protein
MATLTAAAKTGSALGFGDVVGVHSPLAHAACSTSDARVVLTKAMSRQDHGTPDPGGTVSLWYSANCRQVAAQDSHPNESCTSASDENAAGCGVVDVLHHDGSLNRVCDDIGVGSTGCKTVWVDDANVTQSALGYYAYTRFGTQVLGQTGQF